MPFEQFNLEGLDKERRQAIAKSLRTINVFILQWAAAPGFPVHDQP